MTPLTFSLLVLQATLLFVACIHFSDLFLLDKPVARFGRLVGVLVLPLGIGWYAQDLDPLRYLSDPTDCAVIVLLIGGVRMWAVSAETRRLIADHQRMTLEAQAAAEAARQALEAERVLAVNAALAQRQVRDAQLKTAPARHLTPSILHGGARSPRFPKPPGT